MMRKQLSCLALMFVFLLTPVFALQISPAEIMLSSDTIHTQTIRVSGTPGTKLLLTLPDKFVSASLSSGTNDITIPDTGVLELQVRLQTKTSTPGRHYDYLLITEQTSSDGVGGQSQLAQKIIVNVPYNEPYLEASWHIQDWRAPTSSTIMITNWGLTPVTASPEVHIEDTTVSTTPQELTYAETKKFLLAAPDIALPDGTYTATLHLPYSDQTSSKTVYLGVPEIEIYDIDIANLGTNSISRFNITLNTSWLGQLPVTVLPSILLVNATNSTPLLNEPTKTRWVFDKQHIVFGSKEHSSEEGTRASVDFFWDPGEIPEGEYTLSLKLMTGDYEQEVYYSIIISEPSIFSRTVGVLIILSLLLLLITLIYQLYRLYHN